MKYFTFFSVLVCLHAFGHSGGTDSSGCHHDHKRGGYHCHQSDEAKTDKTREPASVAPAHEDQMVNEKIYLDPTK
jgi:hypothetical protein